MTRSLLTSVADRNSGLLPNWAAATTVQDPRNDGLIGKGMFAVVDQAVVSAASFFTAVIIGRSCSPAEFGVYLLGLTLVLLARGVQNELISTPYMIYCSRRHGGALATYSGSSMVHQVVFSLLILGVLEGGRIILGAGVGGSAMLGRVLPTVALVVPLLLLREFIRQWEFAHLRPAAALALDVAVAVVQLSALLLAAHYHMLTASSAYWVMGAAAALVSLVWARRIVLNFDVQLPRLMPDWRQNWSFGRWSLAGFLTGSTVPLLMPWILTYFHDKAATGHFAACASLVGLAGMFVTGVGNFLTPRTASGFAYGGVAELMRVLRSAATAYLLAVGLFCILALTVGGQLAVWIYGPRYAGLGAVISILAFNVLVNSMGVTIGHGLWAIERPRASFVADVFALTAAIAASYLLVPPLGAAGAALATLISTCCGTAVRLLLLYASLRSLKYQAAVT